MIRVLILGGSGQVGKALQHSAPADAELIVPGSAAVDMRDSESLERAVHDSKPDIIINCAAFTRVDDAETEPADAALINTTAPGVLAALATDRRARFVHVSTDYVFDGFGAAPYETSAKPSPLNVYGATKLDGEVAVMRACPDAAVVRTAWVHSGGGVNFVATAVRVLRNGTVMRVVDDQVSTPTRAANLAQALWTLSVTPAVRGVLHFTDAGVASWYDVAECVLEALQRSGVAGAGAAVVPVNSSAFPRPARRPRVSLLDKHSGWAALGSTPAHWRAGVIASTHELIHA